MTRTKIPTAKELAARMADEIERRGLISSRLFRLSDETMIRVIDDRKLYDQTGAAFYGDPRCGYDTGWPSPRLSSLFRSRGARYEQLLGQLADGLGLERADEDGGKLDPRARLWRWNDNQLTSLMEESPDDDDVAKVARDEAVAALRKYANA
jgi:hypothetical protein